jgi:hypothetical protein
LPNADSCRASRVAKPTIWPKARGRRLERILLWGARRIDEARQVAGQKDERMRLLHHFTVLAMAAMTLIATAGGCTHIAEAIDCDEMCREVQDCVDSDLDVHRCAERCEDKVDDSPLARQLDACTDCLEGDYACGEVAEQCPMCQSVSEAIIE